MPMESNARPECRRGAKLMTCFYCRDGQCALSTDILPGIQKLPPAAVSVITRTARDALTMVSDVSPRPLRGRHSLHPGVQPGLQFKPCRGNTA
jgi:hypothetical protein